MSKKKQEPEDEDCEAFDARVTATANEMMDVLFSPPEGDETVEEWEAKASRLIKEKLDVHSLLEILMRADVMFAAHKARESANKRHTANREAKEKVFTWCDENMARFRSMEKAAEDIAETFVPQSAATIRGWMTEWKKLRAASRA